MTEKAKRAKKIEKVKENGAETSREIKDMRLIVVYLIGITWAIYAYSNVFFMLAPYLALKGFPSERVGILVGAFYAATTLVRPLGGWIVERVGMKRALTVSSAFCLGIAFFMFTTVSFWPLFWIRLAMGCGYGIFVVALTTYQSLVIPEETRGLAFVYITLGALACLFTVVPLTDWCLTQNHTTAFLAIPLFTASLCVALSFRLPLSPSQATIGAGKWGTWGELYRDTPFWRTSISCALFGLCDASIVYLPSLALSMKLVPSSFVIANGLGALAARILGRGFFNRHPRYIFAGPSLLVMAIFLCLVTTAASNLWLFGCGLFYGVGMGYGFPAHLALAGDLAPARLRAKSSSLVHFCYDASWLVLPVLIGFGTPYVGEMGVFRFLGLFDVVSGVGVTVMWALYAKSLAPLNPKT
ncbi:MAG: MFS transporter [Synergistaceae bacterium]|jgi:MFS family permease|nr:MFS transporter [Synergistaceae bacterium]